MHRIEVENITHCFSDTRALDGVTLALEGGRIYGLLGRNGAGKTTLLNIIANRLFPTRGEARINGMPARENDAAQALVHMMSEEGMYPDGMRVGDVFKWTSALRGGAFDMEGARRMADAFGLDTRKKVRSLSTGYTSIYKLVTALNVFVPFLLLDEPVLGLDANHRDLLYRLLLESYAERPRTIVLSTHLIEEVAGLIEDVIILHAGRVLRKAPVEDLLSGGYAVSGPAALVDAYAAGREAIGQEALGGFKTIYILGEKDPAALPEGVETSRMDLQRLFIQLTGQDTTQGKGGKAS